MASIAFPALAPNEYELQRGMKRQVSALLRRVRNPRALAAMPMMNAICSEMGTANPVSALERVVLTVFDGDDRAASELRDAILKADFARETTNAELARRSGVSRRHFQRRRAEAVAAIAHYARGILERSGERLQPGCGDLANLQRRASGTPFAREWQAFFEARDRDAVLEMRAIAGNMMRLAEGRAQHGIAADLRADANARLGRLDEAKELGALLAPASRTLLAARLALLDGDCSAAHAYARAALPLFEDDDAQRLRCWCLIVQTASGPPQWRPSLEAPRPSSDSWSNLALEVERSRRCVRSGNCVDAARTARAAHQCAQERSFAELEVQSAGIVQAAAQAQRDFGAARWWRALAVERLLPTQDRLLAMVLGRECGGHQELGMDRLLINVLYERLTLVVPQMAGDNDAQAAAVSELLACVLDSIVARREFPDRLTKAVRAVRAGDSAFAHYCGSQIDAICETMALALAAISGKAWDEVFEALSQALGRVAVRLRPVERRSIAVVTSRSQQAKLVHFRVNDYERPGLRGEPVEALADLRLRLVSV